MKKLIFKYLTRSQRDYIDFLFRSLHTKSVSKSLSFRVRNVFKNFFEGVIDYDYETGMYNKYFIEPQTTVSIKDLAITNLKVYRYRKVLTLEITTLRPGVCIGKKGDLIDAYKKYISEHINEKISIHLVEMKDLFTF